jgi:hypothetical protein
MIATFTSDVKNGTFRAGARQVPKLARTGLLAFLKAKKVKRAWIKSVSEMMETELGLQTIAFAMGWALKFVPGLKEDPRAIALAKEWRVAAIASVEDSVMNELMQFMAPAFAHVLSMPMPEKIRVSTEVPNSSESDECAEEDVAEVEARVSES